MKGKLYSLILGASALAGCTTTEYTQKDLAGMLADNQISYADSQAFNKKHADLKQKIDSLNGDERTNAEALLTDLGSVIAHYKANAKFKVIPVADIMSVAGVENLNGNEYFPESAIELDYLSLVRYLGQERTDSLVQKMRGSWSSTNGNKAVALGRYERIGYNDWVNLFGQTPKVAELLASQERGAEFIKSNTTAVGLIDDTGVIIANIPESLKIKTEETPTEQPAEEPKAQ